MKIYLKASKRVSIDNLMKRCSYKKHNGYIKETDCGRFHIKELVPGELEIHFDITVDHKHLVIPMPERCGNERRKILRQMYKMYGYPRKVTGRLKEADWKKYVYVRM